MVYGDKKVGKSTFASRLKNPVFFDCEKALRSVTMPDGKGVTALPVNSWENILEHTKLFLDNPPSKTGVNTIVVDGMHECYAYLREYILKANNVEDENEGVLSYGKGKRVIQTHMRQWFNNLKRLTENGYGVVLVAHSKIVEISNNGTKYDKRVPLISGDAVESGWEIIKPCVDLIIYAWKVEARAGARHMMTTKGTQLYEAADPTSDARLPAEVPFSYKGIEDAYNKTTTKKASDNESS